MEVRLSLTVETSELDADNTLADIDEV